MNKYSRFFKKGFLYLHRKIKGVYAAFYLVYSAPVSAESLSVNKSVKEEAKKELRAGNKKEGFSSVFDGALAV